MNIYSFSVAIFSYGVLMVNVLVLARRRDQVAYRFLLFGCSVFCWGFIFSFWINQSYSAATTLLLVRISYIFVIFIPVTWLHFIMTFSGAREPFKYFLLGNYCYAGILLVVSQTPLFFTGTHEFMGFEYLPKPAIAHHWHLAQFVTVVPVGFYYLIKEYMHSDSIKKTQILCLLTGTGVGFFAGLTPYLAFYRVAQLFILLVAMPLYPLLTGIALIRYGLFDVKEITESFRKDKLAAIGVLSSSMNHEIRNPLYIINGIAESHLSNIKEKLYKNPEIMEKKTTEVLQRTLDQSSRAMDIMKRFSLFAKQGLNDSTNAVSVSIKETFENILPMIRYELQIDQIMLAIIIPDELSAVKADPRQLEEILFNLIINAIQAIKSTGGPGKIEIDATEKEQTVCLLIKDSGPGIPEDRLRKIFEPFHTTKAEGTGLGLYITKQLVEKNRGKISVRSKEAVGTAFELEFSK